MLKDNKMSIVILTKNAQLISNERWPILLFPMSPKTKESCIFFTHWWLN